MLYKVAEEDRKSKHSANIDVIGAGLGALGLNAAVPHIAKKESKIESKIIGPEITVKRHNVEMKAKQELLDKYKRMYDEADKKLEELYNDYLKGKIGKDLYEQESSKYYSQKFRAEKATNYTQGDINFSKELYGPRVRFYNRAKKIYDKVHRLKAGAQIGATGLGLYAIGKTLYNAYHSKDDNESQNSTVVDKYVIPSGALGLSVVNMSRGARMYSSNKEFNIQNKQKAENEIKNILASYGGKDLDLKDLDKTKVFFRKKILEEIEDNPKFFNSTKHYNDSSSFDEWTSFLENYKTGNLKRNIGAVLFGVGGLGAALSTLLIGKNAYKDLKSNKNKVT